MIFFVFIVLWVISSIAACYLFEEAWLFRWDVRTNDRAFFILLSCLGPVSLLTAGCVYLLEWNDHQPKQPKPVRPYKAPKSYPVLRPKKGF